MTFRIRDASSADEATIIALIQALNEDAMRFEPYMHGREPALAYFAQFSANLAENAGFILLAESAGEVVGLLAGHDIHDDPAIEPAERDGGLVCELYVSPKARGQGIASALLTEAERRFTARGFRRMLVSVVTANSEAVRLYRKYGFGDHVSLMQKRLG